VQPNHGHRYLKAHLEELASTVLVSCLTLRRFHTLLTFVGFGGTNAYAIIKRYKAENCGNIISNNDAYRVLSFTFSAASEKSLRAQIAAFSAYL
jgi:hypothetical protein